MWRNDILKEQAYIFRKQIITLGVLILCNIISLLLELHFKIVVAILVYEIVVLGLTFIPSIRRVLKYPRWLHVIIYELPFIMTIFFPANTVRHDIDYYLYMLVFSLLATFLLLIISKKQYLKNINAISVCIPLKLKSYILEIIKIIFWALCEEICFRRFFVGWLMLEFGEITILGSALLFTYTHYLNRWANVMFNVHIYLSQFILGLILGSAYYLSGSLFITTICHLLFNSSTICNLTIRLKKNYQNDHVFFDDY